MTWTWTLTVAATIALIANIKKKRWCFAVWILTNAGLAIINWRLQLYAQSVLFMVQGVFAVWGLVEWGMAEEGVRG